MRSSDRLLLGSAPWLSAVSPLAAQSQDTPAHPQLREVPIRVVHVKGSHYDAGYQLGTQLKEDFVRDVEEMKREDGWPKLRAAAELFLQYSKKYLIIG